MSEGLTATVKSLLQTAQGSGMSDELLKGAISAAVDAQITNTRGMIDASQKQITAAKTRGNEVDPSLQVDQSVMRAYRGAQALKKQISGIPLPSQKTSEPGLLSTFGNTIKNIYNGGVESGGSHPLGGKVVHYKGKTYNVDSKGNMTEVGQ